MRAIQPVVDAQDARRRIERRRFKRLRGLIRSGLERARGLLGAARRRPPLAEFGRELPYLELVCLPSYLVTVETLTRSETRAASVLVDARSEQPSIVDPADFMFREAGGETFQPTVDKARAVEIARSALLTTILRSPGWGAKPQLGPTRKVELVQYPFWVYYFQRRPGRLDIRVLDAVTGSPPGAKVKASLLQAFVGVGKRD